MRNLGHPDISGFWILICTVSTLFHKVYFLRLPGGLFPFPLFPFIFRQILLIIGLLNHQKDFAVSFACQLLYTCKLKQRLHDIASI